MSMCHLLPGRVKRSVLKSHFTPLVWGLVQNPKGGDMYIVTYISICVCVCIYIYMCVYICAKIHIHIYVI